MSESVQRKLPEMAFSECGWYCINVHSIGKCTTDEIINILKQCCKDQSISWNPLYLKEGGETDDLDDDPPKFSFFVHTYGQARALRSMCVPEKDKIWLRVMLIAPEPTIDNEYKLKLREILSKRYNRGELSADLSAFYKEQLLGDMFCGLSTKCCMTAVIDLMGEIMPRLHKLCLSGNFLKELSAFEGIEKQLPELRIISLTGNQLQRLKSLRVFALLPLIELNVDDNPLSKQINPSELLTILPNLKVVDGKAVRISRLQRTSSSPNLPRTQSHIPTTSRRKSRRDSNATSKDNVLNITNSRGVSQTTSFAVDPNSLKAFRSASTDRTSTTNISTRVKTPISKISTSNPNSPRSTSVKSFNVNNHYNTSADKPKSSKRGQNVRTTSGRSPRVKKVEQNIITTSSSINELPICEQSPEVTDSTQTSTEIIEKHSPETLTTSVTIMNADTPPWTKSSTSIASGTSNPSSECSSFSECVPIAESSTIDESPKTMMNSIATESFVDAVNYSISELPQFTETTIIPMNEDSTSAVRSSPRAESSQGIKCSPNIESTSPERSSIGEDTQVTNNTSKTFTESFFDAFDYCISEHPQFTKNFPTTTIYPMAKDSSSAVRSSPRAESSQGIKCSPNIESTSPERSSIGEHTQVTNNTSKTFTESFFDAFDYCISEHPQFTKNFPTTTIYPMAKDSSSAIKSSPRTESSQEMEYSPRMKTSSTIKSTLTEQCRNAESSNVISLITENCSDAESSRIAENALVPEKSSNTIIYPIPGNSLAAESSQVTQSSSNFNITPITPSSSIAENSKISDIFIATKNPLNADNVPTLKSPNPTGNRSLADIVAETLERANNFLKLYSTSSFKTDKSLYTGSLANSNASSSVNTPRIAVIKSNEKSNSFKAQQFDTTPKTDNTVYYDNPEDNAEDTHNPDNLMTSSKLETPLGPKFLRLLEDVNQVSNPPYAEARESLTEIQKKSVGLVNVNDACKTVKDESSPITPAQKKAAHADLQRFLNEYIKAFDKKRTELDWFYHKKAMVVFIDDLNNNSPPLEMSRRKAMAKFREWPRTRHLLTTISVTLTVLQPEHICFNVSGCYTYPYRPSEFCYFIYTFVLTPLPKVTPDYRIWNEYIYTSRATDSVGMLMSSERNSLSLETNFRQRIDTFLSQIEDRITELQKRTNMKRDWCYKCLLDSHWNLEDATVIFEKMHQSRMIPHVAFTKRNEMNPSSIEYC